MKEAVVYVVDSRASQAVSLLDGTSTWDAVQQHVREHVGAVYRQTASSLVSIVVCGTNSTENHLVVQPDEVTDTNSTSTTSKISSHSHQFAHLTELSFGMEKPNVALVRRWRDYAKENINNHLHAHDNYQQIDGTLTDGLRLALQMMKQQTAAKQFRRSVWLYTTTDNQYKRCQTPSSIPYKLPIFPFSFFTRFQRFSVEKKTIRRFPVFCKYSF